jgi:hypothetical protein
MADDHGIAVLHQPLLAQDSLRFFEAIFPGKNH